MDTNQKPTLFHPGIGKKGMNALHFAAYCGDISELIIQLDAGVQPNAKDQYRGYTAVHWLVEMAATGGPRVEMLRLLVAKGADINLLSGNGMTAVKLAREAGSVGAAELEQELFKLGAQNVGP
jgi:ankyrin repeat protein